MFWRTKVRPVLAKSSLRTSTWALIWDSLRSNVSVGFHILGERNIRHISGGKSAARRNGVEVNINGRKGNLRLNCDLVGLEVSLRNLDLSVGDGGSTFSVKNWKSLSYGRKIAQHRPAENRWSGQKQSKSSIAEMHRKIGFSRRSCKDGGARTLTIAAFPTFCVTVLYGEQGLCRSSTKSVVHI